MLYNRSRMPRIVLDLILLEESQTDKRVARQQISPVLVQKLKGNEIDRDGLGVANPSLTINALK